MPNVLDPFIVTENLQSLGDRLVDTTGAHLDRVFNSRGDLSRKPCTSSEPRHDLSDICKLI
jgi:hypothetical protein